MLCVAASPEFESSVCMACSPPTGPRARIATRTLIHEQRRRACASRVLSRKRRVDRLGHAGYCSRRKKRRLASIFPSDRRASTPPLSMNLVQVVRGVLNTVHMNLSWTTNHVPSSPGRPSWPSGHGYRQACKKALYLDRYAAQYGQQRPDSVSTSPAAGAVLVLQSPTPRNPKALVIRSPPSPRRRSLSLPSAPRKVGLGPPIPTASLPSLRSNRRPCPALSLSEPFVLSPTRAMHWHCHGHLPPMCLRPHHLLTLLAIFTCFCPSIQAAVPALLPLPLPINASPSTSTVPP
ncbi:hypothetical protein PSV08DRAFT_243410 [Bipolaris maydis]|uniref:uncharacterized protein n=1 Tax=Cochliobolus heterostrophus TaxID=5016 RepID=UPI0024D03469|nr:hypothetical protein J3E73DRAFT_253927 [Bipolaris maydis]KAJ5065855.1 hypothetical protein J3E74DRAFT_286278 [Bipolaris maydis]KAJ6274331.1 hypothetical protein PSV08DRAFT_243410 [Bipolaris maydis]KAJ6286385.1 hypothetical protein J3E71DRAFT_237244 [Bipolaris maydis]